MKKFVWVVLTVVAVLLIVSAFAHINVRTTRVIDRYWQGNGTIHMIYETRESRLLTGETIRSETFETEEYGEWTDFLTKPAVDRGTIVSMYIY